MQTPRFLPHIAKECAAHKGSWNGKAKAHVEAQEHVGPSKADVFLEQNPEARANLERLTAMRRSRKQ